MKKIFFLLLFLIGYYQLNAQSVDIPALFQPGLRVGGLYMPDVHVDSVKYNMYRFRTTVIIPLNGQLKVELGKLNVAARQSFLTVNAGLRETHYSPVPRTNQIYNFAMGFTHFRASISNGIWVYHARVGFDNDLKSDRNTFVTALAGGARVYIKGLNKLNIFGVGLVYNGRVIPFPVFGIRRQVAEDLTFTMILPVEASLNYKLGSKFEAEFKATVSSLKTGFMVDSNNTQFRQKYWNSTVFLSNYNLQTNLLFIYKPSKTVQIYAEGGVYPFLRLSVTESNDRTKIEKHDAYFAPYFGLTLRFNLGKFLFGSQLFGSDE